MNARTKIFVTFVLVHGLVGFAFLGGIYAASRGHSVAWVLAPVAMLLLSLIFCAPGWILNSLPDPSVREMKFLPLALMLAFVLFNLVIVPFLAVLLKAQ